MKEKIKKWFDKRGMALSQIIILVVGIVAIESEVKEVNGV